MDNFSFQHDEEDGKVFTITRPIINDKQENKNLLVEVHSKSKYLKNSKFYRHLSLFLTIIIILLLIILGSLIAVYLRFHINFQTICTTDECLRSAANLRYSIDFNVNPCDDFYKFVCGKWSNEHPNHGWFPSFSTFSTIQERILIQSQLFLNSDDLVNNTEPLPVKQTRYFYKSCMDIDSIDDLGFSILFKYLKEADLPSIPSIFTKNEDEINNFKFNWIKYDAKLKKLFAMDIFIGFIVDANTFNESENVMFIGSPGQVCPLPSTFSRLNKNKIRHKLDQDDNEIDYNEVKRNANEKIIKFILSEIIKNYTNEMPENELLNQTTQVLLNMTKFIDNLITIFTSFDDYIAKPYSILDYQNETVNFLLKNCNKTLPNIFEKYLTYIFEGTNISININKEYFYITDFEYNYLPKIFSYILNTPDIYLELYVWWMAVYAMIINTSSDVVEYIFKQSLTIQPDSTTTTISRSIECTALVTNFMALAVSYGIGNPKFLNETKPKVEEMLFEIKNAFVQRVNEISWMDSKTKKATLAKSKEMVSFIGYPQWLFEDGALQVYYKGIVIKSNTYLENMMNIIKKIVPSKLIQLRKINKRDWKTDPTTVNAFNSFTDNAINIPMAILTYPVYNLGLKALNYGAIGTVLGHELTHGFDNTGRKHDKFGNYKQWWSNETINTFEEKIKCFINQYNNFTIEGVDEQHVNGKITLDENLADNGGLAHAFLAYENLLKKFGPEPNLPGFQDYDNEKMFFIAFGSIWCESVTKENLKTQIEYDEHSPNSIRVLGTLQNSPEFARIFQCPKGSKMNPQRNKCKIW